jgi:parvulin-like peptidyl-prolyl isomerase
MKQPRPVILLLAVLCALALALVGCGGSDDGDVPGDAVAVVNGDEVPREDYDALLARAQSSFKSRKREFPAAGTPEYQQLKRQAMEILTQRVQFEQKAGDLGIEVTDKQVDARLQQLKVQFFSGNDKLYREQLKRGGLTEAEVKKDIRSQLVSEAIYNRVTENVAVTDAEIATYYRQHKADYSTKESRDILHILVAKKPLADRLYGELGDGANFSALARKHSLDPGSKAQGGRMTVERGETVAPFDQTVFLLDVDQTSRPIKSEYGYHIIRAVSKVKPASTEPLGEVKERIRQTLLQKKKNDEMAKWVAKTRREYADDIRYQVGFAPPATTAATPAG